MTIESVVAGAIGGIFSGFGLLALAATFLKEKWLAEAKSASDKELEAHKDTLSKSTYVIKARFDTELGAYREVWAALGQVRLTSRGLLFGGQFQPPLIDPNDLRDYQVRTFTEASTNFHDAHNAALVAIDKHAPFVERAIRQAAHSVTFADMAIMEAYPHVIEHDFSDGWFKLLEERVGAVVSLIENVELLIRDRLDNILSAS